MKARLWFALVLLFATPRLYAAPGVRVLIRDIASVEGVRDNALIGYGLVVGLNGTGDRRQTLFTTQTLASVLLRMGVQVPAGSIRVNNVAAVFVTATLPPFARSGTQLDVTVSSVGDAKSLEGGLLLFTTLRGPDGEVYATAQGPVALGGFTAGSAGNSKQLNHPTVARIPSGGLVERDAPTDLSKLPHLTLILADQNFGAAEAVATAINTEFGLPVANVADSRRIELAVDRLPAHNVPAMLARIETLPVTIQPKPKVVVNERTGTVVIGKDVKLGAASILHGSLTIDISTEFGVSQPGPFSNGTTTPVEQPTVRAAESQARKIELNEGASVQDLVNGLQRIGATTRDVISILQALRTAGALQAEVEII
jgi:flagellar P-ring protein precursor FlgI